MHQHPQDQGGRPEQGGPGAADAAGARHRAQPDRPRAEGAAYTDAAQYLDHMWQSHTAPAAAPGEPVSPDGPTRVVPVFQAPQEPAPGVPESDLGAYAMGFGPGPLPPEDAAASAPRRGRRKAVVIWSAVGALVLVGGGLGAAALLNGDDPGSEASTVGGVTPTAPPPASPITPPAPPTVPSTSSAGPSDTASGSGSPSKSGSRSPSGSASGTASGSPSGTGKPKVDTDDDGITDDPGATDPNKLVGAARTAYFEAKGAMAAQGITMTLTSGKRSYEHQKDLWDKEVRLKGSTPAARMRVLPPDESSHVDGNAIDINVAAQPWMKTNGKQYGWCQIYSNESWHFEYKAAHKQGCPALKPHP